MLIALVYNIYEYFDDPDFFRRYSAKNHYIIIIYYITYFSFIFVVSPTLIHDRCIDFVIPIEV